MPDIYTKNRAITAAANSFNVIFLHIFNFCQGKDSNGAVPCMNASRKSLLLPAELTKFRRAAISSVSCFILNYRVGLLLTQWAHYLLLPPQPSLSSFATSGVLDNGCCEINGWKRFPFHFQQSVFFLSFFHLRTFWLMIEDLAFIYWGATAWQRCHLGAFRPVTAEFLASGSWNKRFGTNVQLMSRKDNFSFFN